MQVVAETENAIMEWSPLIVIFAMIKIIFGMTKKFT